MGIDTIPVTVVTGMEAPNAKHQTPGKAQAQSTNNSEAGFNQRLMIGYSLVLGYWDLVPSFALPAR